MDEGLSTISGSGASGVLLSEFRAIADASAADGSPKYAAVPIMVGLAKFIVGMGAGSKRDLPIFELCHFVRAIDGLSDRDGDRALFFLGPEKARASIYRDQVNALKSAGNAIALGVECLENGIALKYDDTCFQILHSRMPFLAALYDFIASIDDYSFYSEFNDIFDKAAVSTPNLEAIKLASNQISARIRQYRRKHLARAQHDEKFNRILRFLRERGKADQVTIDDDALLDFWQTYLVHGEYKAYKTVFDSFINFSKAMDGAALQDKMENALPIGIDFEQNEVDPGENEESLNDLGDWISPLNVLDEEPASQIKFLKRESERRPIENLLLYGPYASRLPQAFLRLESFAPVQAAITTDLRVKRGPSSVLNRLTCDEAITYLDNQKRLAKILDHVRQLQKASFHVLATSTENTDNVVELRPQSPGDIFEVALSNMEADKPEAQAELLEDAAAAFRKLTRVGFDEEVINNPKGIEGFRLGAGALLSIAGQLETFLKRVDLLDKRKRDLKEQFEQDKSIFSDQFEVLYGETA